MPMTLMDLTPIVLSFIAALAMTPVVRALARRIGMVARPKADRWHSRPTALLGGLAIFAAVALVAPLFVPRSPQVVAVLVASGFMFALGLADDLLNLKPYQKLIGQIVCATGVVACRLVLPWTGLLPLDMAITMVWLVGITNAVNLLDNMDGLAAGISAIASAFLAMNFLANGQANEAMLLGILGAALVGFLFYNANPASIFMGDCGSLFIGFLLASSALISPTGGRTRSFLPVLAVPVLCLFVPIFDTLFVMVLRKLAGRPVSRGGRDHTSHRLVTLGLSERRAVFMLYGLATLSGAIAMVVRDSVPDRSIAAIVGFTTLLTLLGVHLGNVKVYGDDETPARERPLVAFLVDLSYKRRVFEVLLDVVLIGLSYYATLALVFGTIGGRGLPRFMGVLPVLVAIKVASLLAVGVYRGLWRYVSLDSLILMAKAVTLGSLAGSVALLVAYRTEALPPAVFVLDWLILLVLMAGSRMSFRLLQRLHPALNANRGRRVLIYGAGDAGDLLARELLNNPTLGYAPVGFGDDDPLKKGKMIQGLRVLGGNGSLLAICKEKGVEEVLISSARIPGHRVNEIVRECQAAGVMLKRMRIEIEELEPEGRWIRDSQEASPARNQRELIPEVSVI